jgi:phospholipid transport system substrate-binding protein
LSRFLRIFLSVCAFAPAAWGTEAADSAVAPAEVVTAFHARLLDNMRHGKQYGCDGRTQHLLPAIDATFDIPFIAQLELRRHWSQLTPAQRNQFVAAYKDLVITTYASEFDGYDGDVFSTLNTKALPNGDQLVLARLKPGRGDSVSFDYVLHPKDGGWRVANVISDGVSNLSLQSEQYTELYQQKGFDALIAWLQDQTRKMRRDCGAKATS